MIGMFVGTTISSIVMFIFRILPISSIGMIIILYFYAIVGGITGFIVHKRVENSEKMVQINNPKKEKLKKAEKLNNPEPEETIRIENYRQTLDEIKNLKGASLILRGLVEARKRLEELKNENNSILEDAVKKIDDKGLDLTENYLQTS